MTDTGELQTARQIIATAAVVVTSNHHSESFSVSGRAPMSPAQLLMYAHFLKYGY